MQNGETYFWPLPPRRDSPMIHQASHSERFYGKPVGSNHCLVKPPSQSAISTVRHSSNGKIMVRMGPLFKAKKKAAAFVDRRWSLPTVDKYRQLDEQRKLRRRTVQVAASRRLLWCYVGNWKKRAFLLWESVCESVFLETGALQFFFCCCFNLFFVYFGYRSAAFCRIQRGYTVNCWSFGEWQLEAEEHGLVFCWDWSSGSHWLPDSSYPRRRSWRKLDKNERQTLPAAGWTRVTERNTAECYGHRKITVHRRPRTLAPGPISSYSSVSWLHRNTWRAELWRHIGMWHVWE